MNSESNVAELIRDLAKKHPDAAYIALGQTALWDEPVKAAWRDLLDRFAPDARLIAGVHDTDYFAKCAALVRDDQPFAMLEHDDMATRGLWSAAGELSSLLGSEDLVTRAAYAANRVPVDKLAEMSPDPKRFLSEETAAYGWRALVDTRPAQRIAADIGLAEIMPALRTQLDWGLDESSDILDGSQRESARACSETLWSWVEEAASRPRCSLSDLYEHLLLHLYSLLMRREPRGVETSRSTELFRFNAETCRLPRFRVVDLFLQPASAAICRSAYDSAVAGGGMYALGEFGEHAIPFDLVVPGTGRGTLHVSPDSVWADLPGTLSAPIRRRVEDAPGLAEALAERFGSETVVVGKAVSLIDMLAAEFIVLFHETASGYTDRTAAMNDKIRAAGITLNMKPIVRVQHRTWDALHAVGDKVRLKLPEHLARAFGSDTITATDFAAQWRGVVDAQSQRLAELRDIRNTRDLLAHLSRIEDRSQCWSCLADRYDKAKSALTEASAAVGRLRRYEGELRRERRAMKQRIAQMQIERGKRFRAKFVPADQAVESATGEPARALAIKRLGAEVAWRTASDERIAAMIGRTRQWTRVIHRLKAQLRRAERLRPLRDARAEIAQIEALAETARMEHVRSAILTQLSLPHTNARPTAWWFPFVDPSGKWFDEVVRTVEARLELL